MNKGRVEAITDGIVAIAATIMVLELAVPATSTWSGLIGELPTIIAYVISFFMIYGVWYMHHNLFEKAEYISGRTYIINGFWIFALTFVPFTTAWVGANPNETVPEFLYALNMLIWSIMFQWLDYQIRKDNPNALRDRSNEMSNRIILYGTFSLCMVLAYVIPPLSLALVGINAIVVMFRLFVTGEE